MKSFDMTLPPDLIGREGSGLVSNLRPRYKNLLPPCNAACPAGENIQQWIALVQEGNSYKAWQALTEVNPMPAIHGRVCYHPCEMGCNRSQADEPVRIHAIERFLGDEAIKNNWDFNLEKGPSGHRVLIIGSGPAGLSAAYHLARKGHSVEIYEAAEKAGGMMRFGIPSYRLPRNVLDSEIHRIERMGVKIHLNRRIDNVLEEKKKGYFDAVFVAIGAHIGSQVDIPSRDAGKVLDAVTYLRDVESGESPPVLGRRVAVYGGGNTAMDAARTAKRLGAEETLIIYRRDREHMPAHDFEATEAEQEGITINWLRTIKGVEHDQIQVEKMQLDENGKPQPTGEFEFLAADSLILALGQKIEADLFKDIPGIELTEDGSIHVNDQFMTGYEGLFAGGDMTPGTRSVTYATGHGRKAAQYIHAWLNHRTWQKPPSPPLIPFEDLQLWYKTDAKSFEQESLPADKRADSFDEVLRGFDEKEARYEASRCYSCGNCFECDSCYGACPEGAIEILGKGRGYRINYELCTGCGACIDQCPTHAISLMDLADVETEA
jgi:NADPH-dependent glutamate synthase beta subunit-like oxidoreductase